MPYITEEARKRVATNNPAFTTAGELNYYLTSGCIMYMEDKELSYQTINDIIGALEGAKAEFYRRVVVPYEDLKIKENGDVY